MSGPGDLTGVSALFDAQAARSPEAVALVHGARRITYAALAARVHQLARYLARRGVAPEVRVAVWADRSIDTVATLLAIVEAGGAYVPLEPSVPASRIAETLRTAGAALLVTDRHRPACETFSSELLILDEHADRIAHEAQTAPLPARRGSVGVRLGDAHPDQLFAVLFTSGSTGAPKGIAMPTSSVLDQIAGMWTHGAFRPGDASLLHRSFTVVGSLWEYFGPLVHGVPSVILSGDDARDPATIWRTLLNERITHLVAAPTLAGALVRHGERHQLRADHLRFAMMPGEPASPRTVEGWTRLFPHATLYTCYGTTEASYIAMHDTVAPQQGAEQTPADERLPVGRPFGGGRVHLVTDGMELAPAGDVGEICVSSPRLARGYLHASRLTAERFVADPWTAASGRVLYRTGDVGRWRADGVLEVLGRRDRQIKIRGFRVELDDVEAAVLRISRARKAAVVARADASGRQTLIAYLETGDADSDGDGDGDGKGNEDAHGDGNGDGNADGAHRDSPMSLEELRRALHAELPEYMVPAFFVTLPSIPLTSSGKLDRRELPPLAPSVAAGAAGARS